MYMNCSALSAQFIQAAVPFSTCCISLNVRGVVGTVLIKAESLLLISCGKAKALIRVHVLDST